MTWDEVVKQGFDKFMRRHEDLEYVVRCKDCKHNLAEPGEWTYCDMIGLVDDDFFCKDGKRKEVEDEGSD